VTSVRAILLIQITFFLKKNPNDIPEKKLETLGKLISTTTIE